MADLADILKQEFPELNVASVTDSYCCSQERLTSAVRYIRDKRLIEDAINLLSAKPEKPIRSSIKYPIIFPGMLQSLTFEVIFATPQNKFIGHINSSDDQGESAQAARFYDMSLEER